MTTTPRRRSRSLPALLVTSAVALAVAGPGVYAALKADAFNTTPQRVDTGTLALTLSAGSFGTAITNVAPGDTRYQLVDLTNSGTLAAKDLTLSVTDSTPTVLSTDATRGLRAVVESCSVAWAADGTCSGTSTPLLGSTPLSSLGSASPAALTSAMSAGQTLRLKVSAVMPDVNETTVNGTKPADSVQGLTANLTWRFSETQRTATTTAVS